MKNVRSINIILYSVRFWLKFNKENQKYAAEYI